MTIVERSRDYSEAVSHFLKLHLQQLKMQALVLARSYNIDLHELLSRTTMTVWEKWPNEFFALQENECLNRTLRILYNHARNLLKNERREASKCGLLSARSWNAWLTRSSHVKIP